MREGEEGKGRGTEGMEMRGWVDREAHGRGAGKRKGGGEDERRDGGRLQGRRQDWCEVKVIKELGEGDEKQQMSITTDGGEQRRGGRGRRSP